MKSLDVVVSNLMLGAFGFGWGMVIGLLVHGPEADGLEYVWGVAGGFSVCAATAIYSRRTHRMTDQRTDAPGCRSSGLSAVRKE